MKKIVLNSFIIIIVLYLSFSFYKVSIDFKKWGEGERFGYLLLSFSFVAIYWLGNLEKIANDK